MAPVCYNQLKVIVNMLNLDDFTILNRWKNPSFTNLINSKRSYVRKAKLFCVFLQQRKIGRRFDQ